MAKRRVLSVIILSAYRAYMYLPVYVKMYRYTQAGGLQNTVKFAKINNYSDENIITVDMYIA